MPGEIPQPVQQPSQNKFKISKKTLLISLIILAIVVVATIAGVYFLSLKKGGDSSSEVAGFEFSKAKFASYNETESTTKPTLASYAIKASEISNLNNVAAHNNSKLPRLQINKNITTALEGDGFFVQPAKPIPGTENPDEIISAGVGRSDDMVDLYAEIGGQVGETYRYPQNAVFVTTDFLLHMYHKLVERTYQKVEEEKLQQTLKKLTKSLFEDSLKRYTGEQDDRVKESLKRNTAYYLVPLVFLETSLPKDKSYFDEDAKGKFLEKDKTFDSTDNIKNTLKSYQKQLPSDIYNLVEAEINLITEANKVEKSPIYGELLPDAPEDYTQFKPRSHYTKSSVLRSYFRALMWFGRKGFDVNNTDLTRDALLISWQLGATTVDGQKASKVWESLYQPTVFFVGESDDLTIYDYSGLMEKIYGKPISFKALSDDKKLKDFQVEAKKLEGPKILSTIKMFDPDRAPTKEELKESTKGFRFMGQRFIPDSYVLGAFTQGDEQPDKETGQKLPSTPTSLMVMSVLGSKTADNYLGQWVKTNAPQSDKVIAKVEKNLKGEFAKFDKTTWTQNIYWSWLYNILPLFDDFQDGYPMFMKNLAWGKKSLNTALGSWTELRHDTLLYAKQSYSEMGAGGDVEPKPVVKGYVEPNLKFFTRLIALNNMTKSGLKSAGLVNQEVVDNFDSFGKALDFFKSIADKELTDTVISDEDYEKLRTIIGVEFPGIIWPVGETYLTERDMRVGIIADVHTDAKKNQVLYEAIGMPSVIYVAVKDKGGTRLTRGVVFSHYEFTGPLGSRLNDEEWQGMVYEGKNKDKLPSEPTWVKEITRQ